MNETCNVETLAPKLPYYRHQSILGCLPKTHLILNLCMTIGNEKCACLMKSVLKPFYVRMKPSNHIPVFLLLNHSISSYASS